MAEWKDFREELMQDPAVRQAYKSARKQAAKAPGGGINRTDLETYYRGGERLLDIQALRALCGDEAIVMTQHVVKRCQERGIAYSALIHAIPHGEIIEQYPDDYPYPSCLILGEGPLHLAVGFGQGTLWVMTAYKPSPDKWEAGWKTRKAGETR